MANAAMQRIRIARISQSASARDPSALRAATGASKRRIGKLWRHSGEQDWRLVEGTKGIREAYVYRPRLVRHRIACYAARAASESWFCRTAAGVWNPCRSMSQVVL